VDVVIQNKGLLNNSTGSLNEFDIEMDEKLRLDNEIKKLSG
jgi:hypothetical protein